MYPGWLVKCIIFSYVYWSFGSLLFWIICSSVLLTFPLVYLSLLYWFVGVLAVFLYESYGYIYFGGGLFTLLCLLMDWHFLSLINSNLPIVFLSGLAIFVSCLRNLCLFQGYKYFILLFSKSCIMLPFALRPAIYLELIFCMMWDKGKYIFSHMDI